MERWKEVSCVYEPLKKICCRPAAIANVAVTGIEACVLTRPDQKRKQDVKYNGGDSIFPSGDACQLGLVSRRALFLDGGRDCFHLAINADRASRQSARLVFVKARVRLLNPLAILVRFLSFRKMILWGEMGTHHAGHTTRV